MKVRFIHLIVLLVSLTSTLSSAASIRDSDDWFVSLNREITRIDTDLENFDPASKDTSLLTVYEQRLDKTIRTAQECIDELEPQIDRLESQHVGEPIAGEQATDTKTAPTARQQNGDSPTVLDDLKARTETRMQQCEALLLSAETLKGRIDTIKLDLLADFLLSRGDTIVDVTQHNFVELDAVVTTGRNFADSRVVITDLSTAEWAYLLLFTIGAWFAGFLLGRRLLVISGRFDEDQITDRMISAALTCLSRSIPWLLSAAVAAAVIASLLPVQPIPTSVALLGSIIFYLLTIVVTRMLLCPCKPASYYFILEEHFAQSLYHRLQFLLILLLFSVFAYITDLKALLTAEQWAFSRAIMMTLIVVNLIWLITFLRHAPGLLGSAMLRSMVSLFLIISLVAELLGYRNFATYLFTSVLGSILLGIALWFINSLLQDLMDSLDEGRGAWQQRLRNRLKLESGQTIPGMLWLRMLSVIVVWTFFIVSLLQLWQYSDTDWKDYMNFLVDGFSIGTIRIMPMQLLLGLAVFAMLLSLIRWFKQNTLPKWISSTNLDHGGREAVVTISGYLGVLIAAIIGLSISGFDFTTLAIVAGALSVGIGFGLQNIVNNFVSGIILLFERPIRTGDWIVVGTTEGYVRKISIRSTQIETFDRADVIVPNSELISNQVTNWMLHDPWGRVIVPVGVAYGTDTRKVEKILLEVAAEHPEVMKDGHRVSEPRVLFRGFGDSSLNFELRCFISNVDKRLSTQSELNFAIDEAFRKNDIEIPFPQRDLHLRSVDADIGFGTKDNDRTAD